MTSDWRPVPIFPDYAVNKAGAVKRITDARTAKAGRFMKTQRLPSGYEVVCLRRDGKSITQYVHALVLEAFVCPRPTSAHQAAHANGIRDDNRVENLRWVLPVENAADKKLHGTDQVGMKHHLRKITDDQVLEIRRLRKQGVYCKDIAARFGLHAAYVSLVANGKRWGHIA
jgi:hypothetical protein